MNIRITALAAAAIIPMAMLADGSITGKVIDKQTGDPIDYATVQLINASTNKPLPIGTTPEADGSFRLTGVKDGKYIIRVTCIGSVDQEKEVTVAGGNVNVGTMSLSEDSKLLKEVVVEGIRSQMRFELDKKVFSVDANIASAGQSASELLESIPSVEVDQDGEVSLRGNSSVTVWINGKESGLTADNRAQILEQIPAETIDRIEVITNPSAKYSPEGTAGIINIILKKDRRGGYFGSAELGATSRGGGNANVSFNYNNSKWDTYASVGFRMRHNEGGSLTRREFADGTHMFSDGKSPSHGNNIFARAGATYHLTDNDEISLNAFGMKGHNWSRTTTDYVSTIPGQWQENTQITRNNGDHHGAHVELGYIHRWSATHSLEMLVGFNDWGGPSNSSFDQRRRYADSSDESVYQYQEQEIGVKSWETKIDYTNQILSWMKLEAGFNGNYNKEDSPVNTLQGTTADDMTVNPLLYNRFIYRNNISALYATLGGSLGKFSFSAGVRAESWQVRSRSLAYGQTEAEVPLFKKNNFAMFPSLFLSYSLPKDNEVQINYTRRIRRPWGGQLNSFKNISDATNISFGNPELEPQYTNAFELNYIKSWTWHVISLSGYLRTSDNNVDRISYMDGDIMYSTWANVAKQVNSGAEIVVKNTLFRSTLDLTTTANLYNNHISAWSYTYTDDLGKSFDMSGNKQNTFSWDIRMMANVRLPWSLSFQATGNYRSRRLTAQGSLDGGWSVDAGLRKTFGDWSVSINARDLFDSRRFKSTTNGVDYTQYSERWRGGRTIRLTVKYSFGNMKDTRSGKNGDDHDDPSSSPYGEAGEM